MSIQPLVANGVPARTEEPLKIWSCINCRRRKVRCDRHDPCAPCIRNKAECVFPVSGRVPRRGGQNSKISKPSTQNQVELLGGLRRLEAMIGDLGSQVEDVAVTSHGVYGIDRSSQPTNGTYVTMSGTRRQTDQPALQTSPNDWTMSGFSASSAGSQSSGLLQTSYESEDVTLDGDGELVVRDRFWTVFCKEVCSLMFK
jgi:hypothetical protein